jgi:peptidoglycan hydrolase-like protein with peptidoglycan-binding domain
MYRTTLVLLALTALPLIASAQTDTTRRRDTTRVAQPTDTTRRIQAEARGEIDLTHAERFTADLPNHGFTTEQAIEIQQALTRAGCDVGTADGIVGQRTLRGIDCFRAQPGIAPTGLESVLTALKVSFARPPVPVEEPAPPPPEPKLPPVLRPDTTYRAVLRARQDSAVGRDSTQRRDSLGRDSTARRDTTARRDSTARRDTTRRPPT